MPTFAPTFSDNFLSDFLSDFRERKKNVNNQMIESIITVNKVSSHAIRKLKHTVNNVSSHAGLIESVILLSVS
jgi:hypothetical protein